MATPLLSVYSASKSYVDVFSRGLCEEYKKKGITIQSVAPGYVVRYVKDVWGFLKEGNDTPDSWSSRVDKLILIFGILVS